MNDGRQERVRVLLLNHVGRIGGAEKGLLALARGLDRNRFECLAAVPDDGPLADELRAAGIEVENLPLRRLRRGRNPLQTADTLLHLLVTVPRLARMIRRRGVRLVHANSNTAQLYAGPAARLAGVACLWHSRDLVRLGGPAVRLGRMADRVAAVSQTVADHLAGEGIEAARIVTVHNGVDVELFAPGRRDGRLRRELGFGEDDFVAAVVGQLVPWKRQDRFLDVAQRVAERCARARFLVVGEDLFAEHADFRRALIEASERPGLRGRVSFAGFRNDMPAVLRAIDVLVHPAEREPFGRVVAEAMMSGRPVVAVNACGPAEIVRNGRDGILVAPGDTQAMAAAVLEIEANPQKAVQLGRAGHERAAKVFDASRTVHRIEELYEELVLQTDRRPGAGFV